MTWSAISFNSLEPMDCLLEDRLTAGLLAINRYSALPCSIKVLGCQEQNRQEPVKYRYSNYTWQAHLRRIAIQPRHVQLTDSYKELRLLGRRRSCPPQKIESAAPHIEQNYVPLYRDLPTETKKVFTVS